MRLIAFGHEDVVLKSFLFAPLAISYAIELLEERGFYSAMIFGFNDLRYYLERDNKGKARFLPIEDL